MPNRGYLNPRAPLPSLMRSLQRAGWGELAENKYKGARAVLKALESLLPDESGEGLVTAYQVQLSAGYSERWTRHCLHLLEDLGLIRWQRGGFRGGKTFAGWVRVVKTTIVEMIKRARRVKDDLTRAHNKETKERLSKLPARVRFKTNERKREAKPQPEVDTGLLSPKGGRSKTFTPCVTPSRRKHSKAQRELARRLDRLEAEHKARTRDVEIQATIDKRIAQEEERRARPVLPLDAREEARALADELRAKRDGANHAALERLRIEKTIKHEREPQSARRSTSPKVAAMLEKLKLRGRL